MTGINIIVPFPENVQPDERKTVEKGLNIYLKNNSEWKSFSKKIDLKLVDAIKKMAYNTGAIPNISH